LAHAVKSNAVAARIRAGIFEELIMGYNVMSL